MYAWGNIAAKTYLELFELQVLKAESWISENSDYYNLAKQKLSLNSVKLFCVAYHREDVLRIETPTLSQVKNTGRNLATIISETCILSPTTTLVPKLTSNRRTVLVQHEGPERGQRRILLALNRAPHCSTYVLMCGCY